MTDELLPYYQRELAFIRSMGAEFSEAHPKIAGRLRSSGGISEDPHVERLIEAVALLNARVRYKLDDDFPELTQGLLGVLYPHYLAPVPSMSIIDMTLDRSQGELTSGYSIPKGTPVETDPIDGEPCRFQTCYPVTVWPFSISFAGVSGPPFHVPSTPFLPQTKSVMRVTLECYSNEVTFGQMELSSLRFFLNGLSQHVYPLYELIFNNVVGIALAESERDPNPVLLGKDCILPVGFERDEGMLPYASRSFVGYRLLTEFFSFPEKFLFFELQGLDAAGTENFGSKVDIYFFLDRHEPDLEHNVTADTLRLGCTPMVNLFPQRAEPIRLTHTESEYRVVPDARRPMATEVFSIDRVVATSPDNEEVEFLPFVSVKHASGVDEQTRFWTATRRTGDTGDSVDQGTDMFLTLVDLDLTTADLGDWTVDIETTCLNRDLPSHLPFGGGQPRLQLPEGGPISSIECLTAPTRTFRPPLRHGTLWRLVSHLSLNHLSLIDNEEGADALREILKLYDFGDSEETRSMIEGILNVTARRVVGRTDSAVSGGFCRGVEVTIDFDEKRFSGSGVYLFAVVLERFLGLYCSINSFSKLVATSNVREGPVRRWPPRAGTKVLL